MPYTVVSAALTYLEKSPRPAFLMFFGQWYALIFGLMVSLVMLVATGFYAPRWTLLWVGLYWFYYYAKKWLRRRSRSTGGWPYHATWFHFLRSLVLIGSVAFYLGYLYVGTDYLAWSQGGDALWLLFLLPVFIMSQRSWPKLLLVVIAVATFLFVLLRLLAAPTWSWLFMREVAVEVLWLILLPLMLHVLLHFVSDWYARTRLLHDIEQRIVQFRSISHEQRLLEAVVKCIASDFGYPHVNIFYLQADGGARCMAGACPTGRALAESNYTLPPGAGIIGQVIQTKAPYLANNVETDPFYQPYPGFIKTRAELVVPIKLDGSLLGVLDVQAHRAESFFPQDVEVMELMASYFSVVLDNVRLMRSKQRINKIVSSISRQFLSQPELSSTLDEIAETARKELRADVVVLYERNPMTQKVIGPIRAGDLFSPELFSATAFEPDSIVQRLLVGADQDYFQEMVQQIPGDPPVLAGPDGAAGKGTFIQREKIQSRAIIRLRTDTACVGLMFLNFRAARHFDQQEKEAIFSFADLAALAIQKAQFHQRHIEFEREHLARQLHDQLMANADAASRIISTLLRGPQCTDQQEAQLMTARDAIQELKRDICYLNDTLKDASLDDLPEEVDKLVHRIGKAYGITLEVSWNGKSNYVPPILTAELKPVLNEAIVNAIRHGEATQVTLAFNVPGDQIEGTIQDNGQGFEPDRVRPRGLVNMRERAERLNGRCMIDSTPGQGTRVSVIIPSLSLHFSN